MVTKQAAAAAAVVQAAVQAAIQASAIQAAALQAAAVQAATIKAAAIQAAVVQAAVVQAAVLQAAGVQAAVVQAAVCRKDKFESQLSVVLKLGRQIFQKKGRVVEFLTSHFRTNLNYFLKNYTFSSFKRCLFKGKLS